LGGVADLPNKVTSYVVSELKKADVTFLSLLLRH
jgi:hypothetical protein